MNDCDEVYNYWEQLHLLLFGRGFQTWEYSPTYAIRSWLYIYIYYIPALIMKLFLGDSKVALFFLLRVMIGFFHGFAEYNLYYAAVARFGSKIAGILFIVNFFSVGIFFASPAFLPSTFSMVMNMYSIAFWLKEKWTPAIACTAISALVGWPFAAVLGLPVVLEMVCIRRGEHLTKFIKVTIISGIAILAVLYTIDSHYYGKTVLASFNIF